MVLAYCGREGWPSDGQCPTVVMLNANKGITEARGAIRGANTMMGNLNNKVNELDIATTMAKVNATIDNMNAFTAKLNSNEGTLGLMLNDANLYNNLNNTVRTADSLLTNVKAHPKTLCTLLSIRKKGQVI